MDTYNMINLYILFNMFNVFNIIEKKQFRFFSSPIANSLSTAKTTPNFGRAQSSHRLEASGTMSGSLAPSEDDSEGPSSTGKVTFNL